VTELLFREDPYLRSCTAKVMALHGSAVELDRTVFYPMAGGQPGDTGRLGASRVVDCRRGERPDSVLHLLEPGAAPPAIGAALEAELDWARRYCHMRFHTALHLLGAVVKAPVSGGRIAADKAHLDFDIEMDRLDKAAIESGVNALVDAGHGTRSSWITDAELESRPELVKTMSVAPPRGAGRVRLMEIAGVDLQACGGTHVRNTREIGRIEVVRIRSEGKRNKRVTLAFAPGSG
jgi:misacylated tRNA(Ala) deacylase